MILMSEAKNPDPPELTLAVQLAVREMDARKSVRPCCERVGNGAWCQRPDGHEGEHASTAVEWGPVAPVRLPLRIGARSLAKSDRIDEIEPTDHDVELGGEG